MLKNVLLINGLSSAATGLLLFLVPDRAAGLFGTVHAWPFIATGLFLVAFGVFVFLQSRKQTPDKGWVKFIIGLDILWVLDSLIVVVPSLWGLSVTGYVLIGLVAAWVGLMALLQIKGLRTAV